MGLITYCKKLKELHSEVHKTFVETTINLTSILIKYDGNEDILKKIEPVYNSRIERNIRYRKMALQSLSKKRINYLMCNMISSVIDFEILVSAVVDLDELNKKDS